MAPRSWSLLWLLLSLPCYLWLGADVFYKTDGPDLLRLLDEGQPHPWHVGYLPLLAGWRWLLGVLGIEPSWMRLGTSLSAIGTAVGVAAFHRGLALLAAPAVVREGGSALLALSPGAILFAGVVEFHAPMLGVVGLACWWTAAQIRRPTWWGMALVGVLTHAAFLVHSSGLLLPAWLLAWFLARRWPPGPPGRLGPLRRELALAAVAGAVHVALWLGLPLLFHGFYGLHADFGAAYAKETSIGRPQSIDYLPTIVVQEWIWPLLPVSVGCLLALGRPALRRELLAFVIGIAPFLYLCVRQLVFEPEHGAYLLPLVPAAALLTAAALPRWLWLLPLLLASSWLAFTGREQALGADTPARYQRFVADLQQAAGGAPFIALVGRHEEMAIGYARLSPMRAGEVVPAAPDAFLWVRSQATLPIELFAPAWAATESGLTIWLGAGRAVLLTAGARTMLADPIAVMKSEKATVETPAIESISGPAFLQALERGYELVPAAGAVGSPTVYRLRRRGG